MIALEPFESVLRLYKLIGRFSNRTCLKSDELSSKGILMELRAHKEMDLFGFKVERFLRAYYSCLLSSSSGSHLLSCLLMGLSTVKLRNPESRSQYFKIANPFYLLL